MPGHYDDLEQDVSFEGDTPSFDLLGGTQGTFSSFQSGPPPGTPMAPPPPSPPPPAPMSLGAAQEGAAFGQALQNPSPVAPTMTPPVAPATPSPATTATPSPSPALPTEPAQTAQPAQASAPKDTSGEMEGGTALTPATPSPMGGGSSTLPTATTSQTGLYESGVEGDVKSDKESDTPATPQPQQYQAGSQAQQYTAGVAYVPPEQPAMTPGQSLAAYNNANPMSGLSPAATASTAPISPEPPAAPAPPASPASPVEPAPPTAPTPSPAGGGTGGAPTGTTGPAGQAGAGGQAGTEGQAGAGAGGYAAGEYDYKGPPTAQSLLGMSLGEDIAASFGFEPGKYGEYFTPITEKMRMAAKEEGYAGMLGERRAQLRQQTDEGRQGLRQSLLQDMMRARQQGGAAGFAGGGAQDVAMGMARDASQLRADQMASQYGRGMYGVRQQIAGRVAAGQQALAQAQKSMFDRALELQRSGASMGGFGDAPSAPPGSMPTPAQVDAAAAGDPGSGAFGVGGGSGDPGMQGEPSSFLQTMQDQWQTGTEYDDWLAQQQAGGDPSLSDPYGAYGGSQGQYGVTNPYQQYHTAYAADTGTGGKLVT